MSIKPRLGRGQTGDRGENPAHSPWAEEEKTRNKHCTAARLSATTVPNPANMHTEQEIDWLGTSYELYVISPNTTPL